MFSAILSNTQMAERMKNFVTEKRLVRRDTVNNFTYEKNERLFVALLLSQFLWLCYLPHHNSWIYYQSVLFFALFHLFGVCIYFMNST